MIDFSIHCLMTDSGKMLNCLKEISDLFFENVSFSENLVFINGTYYGLGTELAKEIIEFIEFDGYEFKELSMVDSNGTLYKFNIIKL